MFQIFWVIVITFIFQLQKQVDLQLLLHLSEKNVYDSWLFFILPSNTCKLEPNYFYSLKTAKSASLWLHAISKHSKNNGLFHFLEERSTWRTSSFSGKLITFRINCLILYDFGWYSIDFQAKRNNFPNRSISLTSSVPRGAISITPLPRSKWPLPDCHFEWTSLLFSPKNKCCWYNYVLKMILIERKGMELNSEAPVSRRSMNFLEKIPVRSFLFRRQSRRRGKFPKTVLSNQNWRYKLSFRVPIMGIYL